MAKKPKVRRFDDGGSYGDGTDGSGVDYNAIDPSIAPTANEAPALSSAPTADQIAAQETPSANIPGSSSSTGALGSILSKLGLGGGNTSNTAALNAAVGILSAVGKYSANKSASKLPTMPALGALPALPGSSTAGYGPAGGYGYQNYANAAAGANGTGYAPRTTTSSAANAKSPTPSYFTYGTGPESQFFQQVTPQGGQIAPVTQVPMARGGAVPRFDMGGVMAQPGQTPMTPRPALPMGGTGAPGGTGMPSQPQQPQMPPRPPMPPQGQPMQRQPQLTPQMQSTMMQRMQAARGQAQPTAQPSMPPMQQPMPQGQVPHMAAGGAANSDAQSWASGPTAVQISNQNGIANMAQSQPIYSQNPRTIANSIVHRGPAHMASGGALGAMPMAGQTGVSRHVTGPGDGTSDSIPARLANGEYVIDAQAVSMLGNGDNSAGAKRLDEFRKNLRMHKGSALSKGQMAPNAKPVEKYMGGN